MFDPSRSKILPRDEFSSKQMCPTQMSSNNLIGPGLFTTLLKHFLPFRMFKEYIIIVGHQQSVR